MSGPALRPRRGFNWMQVSWGGPDEPPLEVCSYCDAPIGEDDVPIAIFNEAGWGAFFCEACQRKWWGLSR
jgi:hypothetical protein